MYNFTFFKPNESAHLLLRTQPSFKSVLNATLLKFLHFPSFLILGFFLILWLKKREENVQTYTFFLCVITENTPEFELY